VITHRRAAARGETRLGWLESRHSFSFGDYWDPEWVGFRSLRVINEDRVDPSAGFGRHPHRAMEIVTVMQGGALAHEDSAGHRSVIVPGTVQRMSAGRGIVHSEMNPSAGEESHFFQIWIETAAPDIPPEYEEGRFPPEEQLGRLRPLASPDRREGSLLIHQDAVIYAATLGAGRTLSYALEPERAAWVQVTRGSVSLAGATLAAGDGAAVEDETRLEIGSEGDGELLLFDLA
jgi:hypothetical protein